jgi:hypothetical protein|tara:strand:- start:3091 stop:3462 length:372 start_codon:yes stop_codon:yes gene_type:complete
MALVNKIDLKLKVNLDTCVMYQIMTYCFFKQIIISNSDLKFLMRLSKDDNIELTKFCIKLVNDNIFKSPQSARNAITKAEKKGLLKKSGINKKTISINKDMNIQKDGLVLLDYKILGNESQEA